MQQLFGLVGVLCLLGGCAHFNTAYRPFAVNDGSGALIDIKQRAILSSTVPTIGPDGKIFYVATVCAEPSPDALSAFSTNLAGSGGNSLDAELALSAQEAAAFVGLRTQSIQLLRDSLYRACEAYMGGGLSRAEYALMLRRYQRSTLALLSVEALTGTVRAPTTILNTSGSAAVAQETEDTLEAIARLEEEKTSLTTAKTAEEGKDGGGNANTIAQYTDDIAKVDEQIEAYRKALENNNRLLASGSATGSVSDVGIASAGSAPSKEIAQAVQKIVETFNDVDDFNGMCLAYMSQSSISSARDAGFGNVAPSPQRRRGESTEEFEARKVAAAAAIARGIEEKELFLTLCRERLTAATELQTLSRQAIIEGERAKIELTRAQIAAGIQENEVETFNRRIDEALRRIDEAGFEFKMELPLAP